MVGKFHSIVAANADQAIHSTWQVSWKEFHSNVVVVPSIDNLCKEVQRVFGILPCKFQAQESGCHCATWTERLYHDFSVVEDARSILHGGLEYAHAKHNSLEVGSFCHQGFFYLSHYVSEGLADRWGWFWLEWHLGMGSAGPSPITVENSRALHDSQLQIKQLQ